MNLKQITNFIVGIPELKPDPDKCYCCGLKPTGNKCVDCGDYYCEYHKADADESPGQWLLCDWCWEVRHAK